MSSRTELWKAVRFTNGSAQNMYETLVSVARSSDSDARGQGIERPGMLSAIYEKFPSAAGPATEVLVRALETEKEMDSATIDRIQKLLVDKESSAPEDEIDIHRTSVAQTAILLSSVLTFEYAKEKILKDREVVGVMGHSLGQITALVAAGVISLLDGIRIVRERGLAMEEAAGDGGPLGTLRGSTGMGMIAVPVLSKKTSVEEIIRAIEATAKETTSDGEVVNVANINSRKQVVISGHVEAMERVLARLQPAVRRSTRLAVRIPFHSEVLRSVEGRMRAIVEEVEFAWPSPVFGSGVKIVRNDSARAMGSAEEARESIVKGCWAPVDWLGSVEYMEKECAGGGSGLDWIGVGPGSSVTAGLVKGTVEQAQEEERVAYVDPQKGGDGWESV
ncbi:acyl transferase/acyl hydrolase/lysophospholipase [Myxozyma melibiosi]|uniref:[acyl-carrier-protein] S-malonyltransferase n=1 Tax=Myxozyma melibiosi TaxID=54550 RepID=A0ABR1FDK2_9ASCO